MPYLKIEKIRTLPKESPSQAQFDTSEYNGRPKFICIIASTPRCGSSLLGRILHKNKLGIPNEYLHSSAHIPFLASRWDLINGNKVDIGKYFLMCFKYRTTDNGVFTCKTHWNQFQPFLKYNLFKEFFAEARFVMIRRQDLLSQAVSYEIANQTGQWSSFWPKFRAPEYSSQGIGSQMQNIAIENASWQYFFASNGIHYHEITYEDLIANPQEEIQTTVDHLVPELKISAQAELKSAGMKKQRDETNSRWIQQFIKENSNWQPMKNAKLNKIDQRDN